MRMTSNPMCPIFGLPCSRLPARVTTCGCAMHAAPSSADAALWAVALYHLCLIASMSQLGCAGPTALCVPCCLSRWSRAAVYGLRSDLKSESMCLGFLERVTQSFMQTTVASDAAHQHYE